MTEKKTPVKEKETSETAEIAVTKKKTAAISKPSRKTSAFAPAAPSDIWQAFDEHLQDSETILRIYFSQRIGLKHFLLYLKSESQR
jgi:hypothetical protein